MPSSAESLVFDKQYYEEIHSRVWRSRNLGTEEEDFITGTEETHEEPQMMLKSDMVSIVYLTTTTITRYDSKLECTNYSHNCE
jgi:hypothetical protein